MRSINFLILLLVMLAIVPGINAHVTGPANVYVRVVSADPATRTYTFSCKMDPENSLLRDWFIRSDDGDIADDPNEAEILDQTGNTLTYTFTTNSFYHIGCQIYNDQIAELYRGDLHIDLRNSAWNPEVIPIVGNGLTGTYQCAFAGLPYTVGWEVVDATTGIRNDIGTGQTITHTVAGHGLYDYVCHASTDTGLKSTGFPVEYFDQGDPYFPDDQGIPDGVTNIWIRDGNSNEYELQPGDPIPTLDLQATVDNSDVSLVLLTTNFIFTSPGIHVPGEGHTHIYLDGIDIVHTPQNTYTLTSLPDGQHTLTAYLMTGDHRFYTLNGNRISDTVDMNIDTSSGGGNQTIYINLQDIPSTCDGGSIVSDTFDGGRHVTCEGNGSTLTITAWDKPGSYDPQYFEMYQTQKTGSGLKICLLATCISDNGFQNSENYPLEGPGDGSGVLVLTNWFDTGTTGVAPNYFHLEIQVSSQSSIHASTDWEVWDQNMSELVWQSVSATGLSRYHLHTPDGEFIGSLSGSSQLDFGSSYNARFRFHDISGAITGWSPLFTFTTLTQQAQGGGFTWTAAPDFKVEPFAGPLDVPVHIAAAPVGMYSSLPDNQEPWLYVTELYGKIKVIHKDGSIVTYASGLLNFDPFSSITGGGQMGLVGLYVDDISGDVYAGMTYLDSNSNIKNKVMRFISSDDGNSVTGTQILISDLPSSASHQVEQITKGPDGKLYLNLGDGLNPGNAQSDSILAGKIVRMNMDGSNVEIYAKGFRNPFGADWRPGTDQLFVTDNAPNTGDRIVRVIPGENYGWGIDDNFATFNAMRIFTTDVSPVDVEFNPGSKGFPGELDGRMYVAVAGPVYTKGETLSKHILELSLDQDGNVINNRELVKYTGSGYGTPIGLDFGLDGLYFTDIYGESGFIGLGKTDAYVFKVSPGVNTGGSTGVSFKAGIEISLWYPKLLGGNVEYEFTCKGLYGSEDYVYDFNYGDGQQVFYDLAGKKLHSYPYTDQDYIVSCTVHDQSNGQQSTASMTINPGNYIAEQQ